MPQWLQAVASEESGRGGNSRPGTVEYGNVSGMRIAPVQNTGQQQIGPDDAYRGNSCPVSLVDSGGAANHGEVVPAPKSEDHLCCQVMHGTRKGGRGM